jgi:hypothetical protein
MNAAGTARNPFRSEKHRDARSVALLADPLPFPAFESIAAFTHSRDSSAVSGVWLVVRDQAQAKGHFHRPT